MTINEISEKAKFDDKGLIPAVIQDYKTGEVLMLAYMNKESLELTIGSGYTHFWSRSRNKLWKKGESSGHVQKVMTIALDCDFDTVLVGVRQNTAACHTGNYSCFFNKADTACSANRDPLPEINGEETGDAGIIQEVYEIILDRMEHPKEGSYTNYLFEKGLDKILKKVGEEASEVIIASKNKVAGEIIYEISDLVYHLLVLMADRGIKPQEILKELKIRQKS
ncbi:MAG: bifunctional phosphoribosyl-AMP cyclohydrolase/phosphoribosyl-ATP diphosphatase HisIE [Eubacteriales bacterium]|nr:bifunctional phosphoribosyl-AMP cyclohydrolase/phosphoribosyl-ATP diphosphatase HisIE [Eubacteriales bacterium]